jgi:hypothetical protein
MAQAPAGRALFPVMGPPLAWMAQGLLGWFVASHASSAAPFALLSARSARVLIAILTAVALAVTVSGIAAARSQLRSARASVDPERAEFLSMAGLVVAGSLTLGVAWAGLVLLVRVCGALE